MIIKLFLHISKEEQKKRFKKLDSSKESSWRVNKQDWKRNKEYESYLRINEEMLEKTDTEYAPWTIIESTDKDYGAMKILTTVADRLAYALEEKKETEKASKKKQGQKPAERFHNGVLSGINLKKSLTKAEYKKNWTSCRNGWRFCTMSCTV